MCKVVGFAEALCRVSVVILGFYLPHCFSQASCRSLCFGGCLILSDKSSDSVIQADFESKFDVKMLENLLNSISTQIPVEKLCSWFKNDVIPFVRRIVPEGQVSGRDLLHSYRFDLV